MELEAGTAAAGGVQPVRCETEVFGELHLVHAAVPRRRNTVDLLLRRVRIRRGTSERLRLEHQRTQVRRLRPVGQPHTGNTYTTAHGGGPY